MYESDGSSAHMRGTIEERRSEEGSSVKNWSQFICGQTRTGQDFVQESTEGSASGEATIIARSDGLSYSIDAHASSPVDLVMKGETVEQLSRFRAQGSGCQVVVVSESESRPVERTLKVGGIQFEGEADPNDADRVAGSKTTTTPLPGGIKTTTIEWHLRRD